MKIWCEDCEGRGFVNAIPHEAINGNLIYTGYSVEDCKQCKGKGYNEIDLDLQEIGRNGRVALAIKNLIESKNGIQYAERINNSLLHYYFYDINTIEELLEWGDKYYEGM